MYHLTDMRNVRSIRKRGLIPMKNRRVKSQDQAVWLFNNLSETSYFLGLKGFDYNSITKPVIFKVNCTGLKINRYGTTNEYYSLRKISPARISSFIGIPVFVEKDGPIEVGAE
jgi:hypothetical protein